MTTSSNSGEGMVQVAFGVNTSNFAVAGRTGRSIRDALKHVWNIPQNAPFLVNGVAANEDTTVVKAGQQVEFGQPGGEKGNDLI